jgi:hypothetical protein
MVGAAVAATAGAAGACVAAGLADVAGERHLLTGRLMSLGVVCITRWVCTGRVGTVNTASVNTLSKIMQSSHTGTGNSPVEAGYELAEVVCAGRRYLRACWRYGIFPC